MKTSDLRYSWHGEVIRVVVAGDVLALPDERWSMGGFGTSITEEWLLHEARLPGTKVRKKVLASVLVRALASHHGQPVGAGTRTVAELRGPEVRCTPCNGSGFVPKDGA